jgi:hypothetical protein
MSAPASDGAKAREKLIFASFILSIAVLGLVLPSFLRSVSRWRVAS